MTRQISSRATSKNASGETPFQLTAATMLSIIERIFVFLLFAYFAFRMVSAPPDKVGMLAILLLVSESLTVILVLFQRRLNARSNRFGDWVLGFAGASLPLLVVAEGPGAMLPQPVCAVIMVIGLRANLGEDHP